MTTTTITAILRHFIGLIEDLTPDTLPEERWQMVRGPGRPLRVWVPDAGGNNMWRRFELGADEGGADLGIQDPRANFTSEVVTITVAYPTGVKRAADAFELRAILAEDGHTLRDAINSTRGRANLAHTATVVDRPSVDRSREDVWFLNLTATVAFYVEQRTRT